jgi:two-component system, chemotaxis family, CheB/CheR fusion protein
MPELSTAMHAPRRLGRPIGGIVLTFAIVAVIVISSTLLVCWMGLRVASADQAVTRNEQIIAGLQELLSAINDAETGQRGFVITGDDTYLEPYSTAMQHLASHFASLDNWANTGDVDADLAQTIKRLTHERLNSLQQTIDERRRGGLSAAVARIQTGAGRKTMDELRSRVKAMENQEKAEHAASSLQRTLATRNRTLVTVVSSAATLLFLVWAFRRIQRAITDVQRQKQLLAVTLASIGDGVIVTDVDGHVTYLNREAERLTGWQSQEATGQFLPDVFRVFNEQTRQPSETPVDTFLRLGDAVGLPNQTLLVARNGREIPIDNSGAPIRNSDGTVEGMVLVFRDFTERRRAEEDLHDAAQRLRSHLENSPVAVIEFDTELRITRWTDAAQRIFGWTAEDVLGRSMWDVPWICEDDRAAVAGVSAQLLTGTQPRSTSPNRNLRKDGSMIWCEWYNSSLRDEQGKLDSIFSVVLDVTERIRAQEAVQHARAAAEAASRAKDSFIAVLSHELRNPLNPVLAAASMLRKQSRFDADTREQLEIICRNAELEARLIDDLLDMTRIERGKIELERRPTELCTIINRAAEVCMPDIAAKRLDFRMNLNPMPSWVEGDPARLQQVFWNLIKNAVKFTPAGGHVDVRSHHDEEGMVIIEVIDSGKGIDPDDLGVIFNAFEQTERSITRQFGGLGLGLAISKAIVDMHAGRITAHSDGEGKGATFTVYLPLLPSQTGVYATPSTTPSSHPPNATRPLRILLVEDHADTARIMRVLLQSQGHDVKIADNVATGIRLAEEQVFDLLLSDLGLPDGTGLSLMRTLRARGSRLPGIALSGYGRENDVQQAHDAGFIAHLTKPISLPRLEEAIARVAAEAVPLRGSPLSV